MPHLQNSFDDAFSLSIRLRMPNSRKFLSNTISKSSQHKAEAAIHGRFNSLFVVGAGPGAQRNTTPRPAVCFTNRPGLELDPDPKRKAVIHRSAVRVLEAGPVGLAEVTATLFTDAVAH